MKTAVLIDGGHLRACALDARKTYDNALIDSFARSCFAGDEYLFRIFYYDAPPFRGKRTLPVSGEEKPFTGSDKWLRDLEKLERFAVRRGTLGFRGWKPRKIPIAGSELKDSDFKPVFEQKGVDMRIGLDIATFAKNRSVERILLVSGDQDMIPAIKEARKAGLEVGVIQLEPPAAPLHDQIASHADFVRVIAWPEARTDPVEVDQVK